MWRTGALPVRPLGFGRLELVVAGTGGTLVAINTSTTFFVLSQHKNPTEEPDCNWGGVWRVASSAWILDYFGHASGSEGMAARGDLTVDRHHYTAGNSQVSFVVACSVNMSPGS